LTYVKEYSTIYLTKLIYQVVEGDWHIPTGNCPFLFYSCILYISWHI